ncbi:MAG: hypothetical protein JSV30_03260 [Candidatus Omnitrophota bacterium]|nr:MAG: hypothetical protein JSV30_03260 [Candidatus Omnitrophota bacterium]
MKTEKDYEDLLKLFNKHKVKYCIIGAFAVAFYAIPRYTKDMDILVEPSLENGCQIIKALNEFGFDKLNLTEEDFNRKGRFIQLGYEPVRIDLITSISGINFEKAWKNRKKGTYGNIKASFIGINELIKSKKIARRKQDKLDLDILLQAKRKI